MERIINKMMWDAGLCLALLFPDLFPQVSFGGGIRIAAVVLMTICTFIATLAVLIMLGVKNPKNGRFFSDRDLESTDIWFKIYEPFSDLLLVICLIIAGHPVIGGWFMFVGVMQRGIRYKELEDYRQERGEK